MRSDRKVFLTDARLRRVADRLSVAGVLAHPPDEPDRGGDARRVETTGR